MHNLSSPPHKMGYQLAARSHSVTVLALSSFLMLQQELETFKKFFKQIKVELVRMPNMVLRNEFNACGKSTAILYTIIHYTVYISTDVSCKLVFRNNWRLNYVFILFSVLHWNGSHPKPKKYVELVLVEILPPPKMHIFRIEWGKISHTNYVTNLVCKMPMFYIFTGSKASSIARCHLRLKGYLYSTIQIP